MTEADKGFLRMLHQGIRFDAAGRRVLLVHGSPRRINEFLFEDRPLSSFERLAASSHADVIVFGHTHKPYTKDVNGVLFLNDGSVGKPKDGDGDNLTQFVAATRKGLHHPETSHLFSYRKSPRVQTNGRYATGHLTTYVPVALSADQGPAGISLTICGRSRPIFADHHRLRRSGSPNVLL